MMDVRKLYVISGYASIVTGCLAAMCISRAGWMFYGLGLSVIGFLLSGTNIFLNAKYFSESEKFAKGYFGMFLSSLPVIFMMVIIFKFRK